MFKIKYLHILKSGMWYEDKLPFAISTGVHFKKWCIMQSKIKTGAINEVLLFCVSKLFCSFLFSETLITVDYFPRLLSSITYAVQERAGNNVGSGTFIC